MITHAKAVKYLKLAKFQAQLFSKDHHTQVATIILSPHNVLLSSGYNGIPAGMDDSIESRWERPTKYMYVTHSEINAICSAARNGTRLDGATAVVTLFPCNDCAKALIQAGIKTIITLKPDYDAPKWGELFKISMEMFQEVGIQVITVSENELS